MSWSCEPLFVLTRPHPPTRRALCWALCVVASVVLVGVVALTGITCSGGGGGYFCAGALSIVIAAGSVTAVVCLGTLFLEMTKKRDPAPRVEAEQAASMVALESLEIEPPEIEPPPPYLSCL